MGQQSRRDRTRLRRRREQLRSRLIWGGLGAVLVIAIGYLVWNAVRPGAGEAVTVMASSEHIPEGTVPGPYNTDPPTSGPHYANSLPARFYEESDVPSAGQYPEGYLVHNLEHGYIIFWYNCNLLDDAECDTLKGQIREVMDEFNSVKLIAFPWETLTDPVVMTSWGRMQALETFDAAQARTFIRANRNRAPEPQAP